MTKLETTVETSVGTSVYTSLKTDTETIAEMTQKKRVDTRVMVMVYSGVKLNPVTNAVIDLNTPIVANAEGKISIRAQMRLKMTVMLHVVTTKSPHCEESDD